MAWLAVDKNGNESIFNYCPKRMSSYWEDKVTYNEVRGYTSSASDYSVHVPKGTIKKLTGKDMDWEDEPIHYGEAPIKYITKCKCCGNPIEVPIYKEDFARYDWDDMVSANDLFPYLDYYQIRMITEHICWACKYKEDNPDD